MKKKIAILAGNYQEFNNFVQFESDSDDEFIYVNRPEKIAGMELKGFLTVGTWYMNEDCLDLLAFVQAHIR